MASPFGRHAYTEDDYFAIERNAVDRHELIDGTILAMAGGRPRHNYLSAQIVARLGDALRAGPCVALSADQRVRTPDGAYTYADGSVFCGDIQRGREETALNPVLLVEVLSDATREYDRTEKLARYKEIASLRHVLLVEPDVVDVEHWFRRGAGWSRRVHTSLGDVIRLDGLEIDVPVASIYAGVERVPA